MLTTENTRTWTYRNDTRSVGELTPCHCESRDGGYQSGWVEIAGFDLIDDPDYANGKRREMRVSGPVYSGQNRERVLDKTPAFVRDSH